MRFLVAAVSALLGVLAFASAPAPALAAAPEAPETLAAKPVFATVAVLNGVLDPAKEGEPGAFELLNYEFVYRPSATGCTGTGEVKTPAALSVGAGKEAVSQEITGLTASTVYTVCLSATGSLSGETAVGPAVTFKTTAATKPEAPQATRVRRGATVVKLFGKLNPGGEGEPGSYRFLYNQSNTACTGGVETTKEASTRSEAQEVSAEIEGLLPGTTYTFCLEAFNALGEATTSAPLTFTTSVPPEAPENLPPTGITATSVTFHGIVNPHKAGERGSYLWFYRQSPTECEGGPFTNGSPATGGREEVTITQTGLNPGDTYTACLTVFNEAEESVTGPPVTFTLLPVGLQSVPSVGATSAVVAAVINPQGSSTGYHVEYVTDAQFHEHEWTGATTAPSPDAQLPSADEPVTVRQTLTGLQPGTLYHFRFRATNSTISSGEDTTFTTASSGEVGSKGCPNSSLVGFSPSLPDCRAYELVSSASEEGEVYVPSGPHDGGSELHTEYPFRAAADGEAIAYVADPGLEGGNGSAGVLRGNDYLARRGALAGTAGWETSNITAPVAEGESSTQPEVDYFRAFSPDLAVGIFSTISPLASPVEPQGPAGCHVMYSHTTADQRNHALFTETQTPGECGVIGGEATSEAFLFTGESEDHTQQFFQTPAALTPGSAPSGSEGNNLYDSLGGKLRPVSVLPSGAAAEHATVGGLSLVAHEAPYLGGAISTDGSRAFWTDVSTGQLYVRENPGRPQSPLGGQGECTTVGDACTLAVSKGPAKFWGATPSGRYAFYAEGEQLWRFDTVTATGEALAAAGLNAGEEAGVKGVLGIGADGSSAYFVAEGVLTREAGLGGNPERRQCVETGTEEKHGVRLPSGKGCNLYLWRAGKPIAYIAPLAAIDDNLNQGHPLVSTDPGGDWSTDLGTRTAQVTEDGTHLVFESTQPLTGYQGGPAAGEAGALEVFVYNATTGRLSCASCNPAGNPLPFLGAAAVATFLPPSASDTFMHRVISSSGTRVFFDSAQPLVPQDINGVQDVYEWEQEGTPSCPTATSRYGGCVFLLSGGESTGRSSFVDADQTGENVFIVHRGKLGRAGPGDTKTHLYDIRVAGGFASTAIGCSAACGEPPPSESGREGPPSLTLPAPAAELPLSGPPKSKTPNAAQLRARHLVATLKRCRATQGKRRRARCERLARSRYGTRPHHSPGNARKGRA